MCAFFKNKIRKGVQMAARCPKCGEKLHWYDMKAECRHCGVNIPNYDWETRLEEDNKVAEEKFQQLYYKLNDFRYAAIGTKLRKNRIWLTFLPAIGFILPWAQIKGELNTLSLDLLGLFTDGTDTIKFFGIFFKRLGDILGGVSQGAPYADFIVGFLLMLLSIVAIVAAWLLAFILFRKPKTKVMCVLDILSIGFAAAAGLMFSQVNADVSAVTTYFKIGNLYFNNASASVMWGIYVYIALLFVALVANILVAKAPVKSKELLEQERLERVRIKEEKEEAERARKEAARAEAARKAEEEQAEKVRKAREALASRENKKK